MTPFNSHPWAGQTWATIRRPGLGMFSPRISLLLVVLPLLATSMFWGPMPTHATVILGPMLEGITATNGYVLAECSVDISSPMTVNYGLTASYGSTATTAFTKPTGQGATNVHRIRLTGLAPNTLYHYQLVGQGTTSLDYTFTTMVNPGTSFRFVWQADFRSTPAIHDQISGRILNTDQPLFVLEAGDTCANGDWRGWHNEFFTANEKELEKRMPIYPSPGNHEGWGTLPQAYYQSPDSTGANGYYSFDCGDLHVTMANFETTYSSGSAQYNWIQQDVQASRKPWKIFGTHAPAYSYGGSGAHAGDTGFQTITTRILEPNGVKVFLAGHNHFYQHDLVNGIRHLTVGSAGAPLYAVSSNLTYTLKSIKDNSYLVADVSPTNLHMMVYNNAGTLLDDINLVKLPAPTGLAATPGVGQAALNWNAVPGATSYSVWYGTNEGGPYSTSKNSTVTNTTITSLVNDTAYYFVVTATDTNGPSAISGQVSAVPTSNQAPVARAVDIIVAAGSDCLGNGSVDYGCFDPDGDPITITQTPPGPYPLGTNLVTLAVADNRGGSNSSSALVIVLDQTPPVLACPADILVTNAHDAWSSVVTFAPNVSDNCSGVGQPVCVPASGTAFSLGVQTVTCTVSDAAGNANQCGFKVTVLPGNAAPVPVIEVAPLAKFPGCTNLMVIAPDGTNATVYFDGSQSYDLDDTNFLYSWSEGTSLFSTSVVATNAFGLGSHAIILRLDDTFPLGTKSASVTVEVISPKEALAIVVALAEDSDLPHNRLQPLLATLNAIAASSDRGNPTAAINQLVAFQNKVLAQVAAANPDLADSLIQAAQQYINALRSDDAGPPGRARLNSVDGRNGKLRLKFVAKPARVHLVQASSNLQDWETRGVAHDNGDGMFDFDDPAATGLPSRYYRILSP
jgi:hypothetical protein